MMWMSVTDSEVERKQALPAILLWEMVLGSAKMEWNGKPIKASMIMLLMRLLEVLAQGFLPTPKKVSMP